MDPNPSRFPILSYVMARLPSFAPRSPTGRFDDDHDIEHQALKPMGYSAEYVIETQMPRLTDPMLLEAMKQAVSEVAESRSVLRALGERPDHETVDRAKMKLADIEAELSGQLDEILLSPRPVDIEGSSSRDGSVSDSKKEVEKEKQAYKAIIRLDEMHEAYEKLIKDAEHRLAKIYKSAEGTIAEGEVSEKEDEEEVNEEVVSILQEALEKGLDRIDLSDRRLRHMPEAFGRIRSLAFLNVLSNQLKAIPDSIARLENLEELNVSSNDLQSLPDSIGLLQKLKILNISGNKLEALPDTICHCRSLVVLDASYNYLSYLPTNLGLELSKLQNLLVHCNKLRSFPSSICEMKSLRYLDAHFNELHGLPVAVGKLSNLEYLNLSSNFSDMRELPGSLGDLINLKELDLSNNQIHSLPDSFGRLENLVKLNLEQNPLVVPPPEVVLQGTEAVKSFMTKWWRDILLEEETKKNLELEGQGQTGWLSRSTSWVKSYVNGVSRYFVPSSPRDSYLDQQF